jgi:ankyrin repeat protein
MREVRLMEKLARKYLENVFNDLLDYEADDPLQPINPLTYKTPEGDTCLHIAAGRGDLKAVALLVDAGIALNARGDLGNTALHYARKRGHNTVVDLLVARGAQVDAVNELGERALVI